MKIDYRNYFLHLGVAALAGISSLSSYAGPTKIVKAEDPVILEKPDGNSTLWCVEGMAYTLTWSGISLEELENVPSEFIEDGKGNIYISNILANALCPGWVKGKIDGDKIEIPVPQKVEEIPWGDEIITYQMNVLKYIEDAPLDNYAFEVDEDVTSITFTRDGDNWNLDLPGNGSVILGLVDPDSDFWIGYADIISTWTPVPWPVVTPPATLNTETYAMIYGEEGHLVEIGNDDSDFFIKGIYSDIPNSWVKGSLTEDCVVFQSNQLLGIKDVFEFALFQGSVFGTVINDDGWEYEDYIPIAEAIFEYDKESNTLTYSEEGAVLINTRLNVSRCLDRYWMPQFYPQLKDISLIPRTPISDPYYDPEVYEGSIAFYISNLNVNGYVLDTNRLYYTVKINGNQILLPGSLDSDDESQLIPYKYSSYDNGIRRYEGGYRVFDYPEAEFISAEVQMVYFDENGDCYKSDVLTIGNSGVDNVATDVSLPAEYYDLTGRKVMAPAHGLFLEKRGKDVRKVILP